jgi:GT2 family glycosyltransferase
VKSQLEDGHHNQTSGQAESPRVAVVVLTYNQRETTLAFLRSLPDWGDVPVDALVWDNGSSDGTADAVRREFPDVHVHEHPSNLGVASGRNAAAAMAIERFTPTHLLFLDNDLELTDGFVQALLSVFDEDTRVAQASAKLRFMHDRELLNDAGGCRINFVTGVTRPVGYGEIDRGQHDRIAPCVAGGAAQMVRTDVFEELGGFDAAFDPFGPEDIDFSLRLQKAGYKALYAPRAMAYHAGSHTFGADYHEDYARHRARHWLTFLRRHGSVLERVGFYLLGAPFRLVRIAVREVRRGNLAALRGIGRGAFDALRGRAR